MMGRKQKMIKRQKQKWVGLCLIGVLLAGCAEVQEKEEEVLRCITFYCSIKGVNSTISAVARSMEEQLKGQEEIQLSNYNLSADLYGSLEYKVDTAIALDMDVMILSGSLSEDDEEACQKLKEAGILLILVDGDKEESGRYAYIGTDNFQAGQETARMVAQQFKQCKVAIVSSPHGTGRDTSSSRYQRRQGFLTEAEEQENISIVGECICSTETLDSIKTIRNFLDEYPQTNVLFCTDSASGVSAAKVVAERGLEDTMYVICFDMPVQVKEEIQRGSIDAAVIQDTEQIGAACIEVLKEIQRGDYSTQDGKITIDCKMVTQENIEENTE